ncbi:hypothetical protein M8R20_08575 [Pseudomonas sp. R2.Fl]|nr:hypothetical protein [Pseudomonas sp. R2.Fl]
MLVPSKIALQHQRFAGKKMRNNKRCMLRMPDMHKKALFTAQKTTISHTADAYGGFSSQFRRSSCSPLEVI